MKSEFRRHLGSNSTVSCKELPVHTRKVAGASTTKLNFHIRLECPGLEVQLQQFGSSAAATKHELFEES